MEVRDIFELRRQGRIEEAYEAIRPMYAAHKGKYTTLCMFWTANDILKKRLQEEQREEAVRIFQALLRVAPHIDDNDGRVHAALLRDALRLNEEVREFRMLDFLERFGVEALTEADWQTPPQPSLARRLLDQAFTEIAKEPTVDNALKAMPLLTEALRRTPGDKQGLPFRDMVKDIIAQAEKEEEAEQEGAPRPTYSQAAPQLSSPLPAPPNSPPIPPLPRSASQRVTLRSSKKEGQGWFQQGAGVVRLEGRTNPGKASHPLHPGMSQKDFGRWGEEVAADYLECKGYRILERDWRSGHRDIDIVARNVDTLVFVEVKTRHTSDFGKPYEAVNYQKRRNLLSSINHYLQYKKLDLKPRFDIISIVATDMSKPEIQHIENVRLT